MEITWRPAPGFEETHEVSDNGEVRSLRRKGRRSGMVLKSWIDPKGYVRVTILGKTKKMHRLVLEAFVRPPADGEEGAHLDGVPGNNALSNLAWKFPVANCADRATHGTVVWGERHGGAKLSYADVIRIRALRAQGMPWKEIHNDYSFVSKSTVIEAGTGVTFRQDHSPCGNPSDRAVRVRAKRRSKADISSDCRPEGGVGS